MTHRSLYWILTLLIIIDIISILIFTFNQMFDYLIIGFVVLLVLGTIRKIVIIDNRFR